MKSNESWKPVAAMMTSASSVRPSLRIRPPPDGAIRTARTRGMARILPSATRLWKESGAVEVVPPKRSAALCPI